MHSAENKISLEPLGLPSISVVPRRTQRARDEVARFHGVAVAVMREMLVNSVFCAPVGVVLKLDDHDTRRMKRIRVNKMRVPVRVWSGDSFMLPPSLGN